MVCAGREGPSITTQKTLNIQVNLFFQTFENKMTLSPIWGQHLWTQGYCSTRFQNKRGLNPYCPSPPIIPFNSEKAGRVNYSSLWVLLRCCDTVFLDYKNLPTQCLERWINELLQHSRRKFGSWKWTPLPALSLNAPDIGPEQTQGVSRWVRW